MKNKLLFIDTETGGRNAEKHRLLSIAFVIWEEGKITNKIELLTNNTKLAVEKSALDVNKINLREHAKVALSEDNAVLLIKKFLSKNFFPGEIITLAGHNVSFDADFLKALFSRTNVSYDKYFSHRSVDTSAILHFLYLSGKMPIKSISSTDAFKLFNIKVKGRHSAMGDATATAELFSKLIKLVKKMADNPLIAESFNFQ